MDSDDALVGKLLTRREMLGVLGAAGMALVVGCSEDGDDAAATSTRAPSSTAASAATAGATESASGASTAVPSCVVRPELTEGPFFVDDMLDRSDIRSDPASGAISEGVPFTLDFNVSAVSDGTCTPLEGAMVDVWHCDALGVYSGVDGDSGAFLRGFQRTDANGRAGFTTVYPGWYPGRAVHIHFKIRTDDGGADAEFTSQLFFDEAVTDQVHAEQPYAQKGERTLLNDGDGIFNQSDGLLTLQAVPSGGGYAATFDIGLLAG